MRKYNLEDSLQPTFTCVIYLVLNQKLIYGLSIFPQYIWNAFILPIYFVRVTIARERLYQMYLHKVNCFDLHSQSQ